MAKAKYKYFLVTGEPGVGKTTLTKKLVSLVEAKNIKVSGFYTEEVRNGRNRTGFDVTTLDGKTGPLARDRSILKGPVKYYVGKYGVLLEEFENIALPCIDEAKGSAGLLVIDEIGKMEFFSEPFKERIRTVFREDSNNIVLATVPSKTSDTIIMNIKNNRNAKLWQVTKENRNTIHEEIFQEIKFTLKFD